MMRLGRNRKEKSEPDEVLLPRYLSGVNEPVATWIHERYFKQLWLLAKWILWQDGSRAEDALQDTAERLCTFADAERPEKFVTLPQQVPAGLRNHLRTCSFNILRRKDGHATTSLPTDEMEELLPPEWPETTTFDLEEKKEKLRQYFAKRELMHHWPYLELYLEHGRATRQILINEMHMEEQKAHNLLNQIKRHLKKFSLYLYK